MIKKIKFISVLLLVLFLVSSFSFKVSPFGIKVIVIDAGHGGKDPGCHGKKHLEKDIALAVALKFGKYIEENFKEVKVVYTRNTDVFVELQERAAIANRVKADLFISIHCNSACVRDKKTKKDICKESSNGAETYVMGIKNEQGNLNIAKRENSAILLEDDYVKKYEGFDPNSDESYIIMSMFADTYLDRSLDFATKIQKQYCQKVGRCDRGVKRASLWVLWRTYMPSVLTEIGYLTNPAEEHFLGSEKGQNYIASGLFRAFREYKDEIDGTSKIYNDAFEKQEPYRMTKEDSLQFTENKEIKTFENDSITENKAVLSDEKKEENPKKKIENAEDIKTFKIPLQKDSIKAAKALKKSGTIVPVPVVIYKVQVLSSDNKIPLDTVLLKGLKNPREYIDNGVYKYIVGEFSNVKDATKYKDSLRNKGFKDAFVIAMKDGKRIPLK